MIIPVRCFSCGKVVGNMWERYENMILEESSEKEALDSLNLQRYCCRRMLLSHINNIDHFAAYTQRGVYNFR